jgi:hypothetical protein
LGAAVRAFDGISVPFEAARAREELAGLLPVAAARDMLAVAVDTYRQLGAVPSLNRARSRLRDLTSVAEP